ncbi:MAG: MBL fold metallo-hydrolase [Phycisphaerales bacterium]|nr:MBL fold metallo-hydrolase [Planctomycetota bacterium]MCH8507429.1 MBL fold metallo-hydrolase [Phycisphaerales bacterium]
MKPAEHTGAAAAPGDGAALCVLASGSSGNCSVLVARPDPSGPRRVVLIDAGLSPRRTARLLLERGIRPDEVDDIVFTHLDTDHCHPGWPAAIRPGGWRARLRIHQRHLGRAERAGLLCRHTEPFDDQLALCEGLDAGVCTMAHDSLGVAAFCFRIGPDDRRTCLGYATDLGRATDDLVGALAGVDLLAIESNYCPRLQRLSDRPEFLKRRITGGAGHLSNAESAEAVARIAPGRVVLLHLSRQCNTPALATAAHERHGRAVTVSSQHAATAWVRARAGQAVRAPGAEPIAPGPFQTGLFQSTGAG